MATTFPATIKPTTSTNNAIQPRTKSIAFGNGYEQITGDGLNSIKENWSLTFVVGDTNKQIIEDFFIATGGYNYFNWTANETGATEKQYLCKNWNIQHMPANNFNITCTFEEWVGLS